MSIKVAALKPLLNSKSLAVRVIAISELVTHEPMLAPIITGTVFFREINPAPTKVTDIEIVEVQSCKIDVKKIPIANAANGLSRKNPNVSLALRACGVTKVKPIVKKLSDNKNMYNRAATIKKNKKHRKRYNF
ncbi:hypothetical protein BpHYR1_040954 [Brachionus plicatilis]|uniref:Uncharacterized protein n=1 Tax=Brachionus plicatilis TaxID=10195 RepID=A0A3M7T417_BRAPC|nr:hypothetical protein BpHYR1_040954 [Brachionus plicatilis]